MSIALPADGIAVHAPSRRRTLELLLGALLWLTGIAGAFVFVEPSPYEIMGLVTIVVFAVSGLALRASLIPLSALLILYVIGFGIAVVPVLDQPKTLMWVMVSLFMAMTTLFFAAMLGTNTEERLKLLMRGYMAAAVIAALAGIVGYFHFVPGVSGMFLLYDRARGTFNDPNVLGAFLVLPALLAFQRVLSRRFIDAARSALLLLLLVAGIFLSFSRGSWGAALFSTAFMMAATYFTSDNLRAKRRIVVAAVVAIAIAAIVICVLLSIDATREFFLQRAALTQDYDAGETGRFGNQLRSLPLLLDRFAGFGPLRFRLVFGLEPHNSYLGAFANDGWLGGLLFALTVGVTVWIGLRLMFKPSPYQRIAQVYFPALAAFFLQAFQIDIDHWRHVFLMLGAIWGLEAARQKWMASGRFTSAPRSSQSASLATNASSAPAAATILLRPRASAGTPFAASRPTQASRSATVISAAASPGPVDAAP